VSRGPYEGLNLAAHVDDDPATVRKNQQTLIEAHHLPHAPRWLRQAHGTRAIDADDQGDQVEVEADAVYTNRPDRICAILTADCLPILLRDHSDLEVAAVHAGWRGLLGGVVDSAVTKFCAPRARLAAWIGPGIGAAAYVVDAEFRDRFLDQDRCLDRAFHYKAGHWHADLYAIAEHRLRESGVGTITRYEGCTYADPDRFYSYRRDCVTGRMASLVWIDSGAARGRRGR
jgi:YfiH family protein